MISLSEVEETKCRWESQGLGKGTCGPCAIAAATNKRIQQIIDGWDDGYKGTAGVREVERELKKYGFVTVFKQGRKAKKLVMPNGYLAALAFIQCKEYKSYIERQKHTHWIFLVMYDGDLQVFCNRDGWFSAATKPEYLNEGYIRSFLVLENYSLKNRQ